MLGSILDKKQEEILAEERRWLADLRVALNRFGISLEDDAALQRSIQQLDELFLLVVVGEFNSGKSAFINALLGQPILAEGVTPTTTRVHLIRYGSTFQRAQESSIVETISAPIDMLREVNLVDTPGTNAIHREHETITQEFVPRSDMVLFVTSADRPFTESERSFLQTIREWGKKVVVVVNKIDILQTDEEIEQVTSFVLENAQSLLGFAPQVFPVSARYALQAKQEKEKLDRLATSRFVAVETYIRETLDEKERIRLKLLNPLGVGMHLDSKYLEQINHQLENLHDDLSTIDDIDRQLGVYQQDMRRDFRFRLAEVDNVLQAFENRGMSFFDETMRLGRIFDLVNKAKLKRDFEQTVMADVPQQIERRVNEIIDWIVSSELRQWQGVMDHLSRRQQHSDRIVGQVGGSFDYDRSRLLETVGQEARRAVDGYDRETEANRLAESVQRAVAGTALVEIGAIGLGAIVTIIATTTLADVTGILAASTVAILGLFVLPARRQQAKKELRIKIAAVRDQLVGSLTRQFDDELERSMQRINEAIAPYTRFIRAERDHLEETSRSLSSIKEQLSILQSDIEAL